MCSRIKDFFHKIMLRIRHICLFSFIVLHLSDAERRVLDGKALTTDRTYVAYMIKANTSVLYDAWMCGGAIVSPWYIVTSAACVEDVKYMYAIAGYRRYVPYDSLNTDQCTSTMKKKVVYVCLPTDYNFDYPRVERWANIDISLVRVESRFNFSDPSYQTRCSYIPTAIEINYDPRLQEPGTDAIVFGWGHTSKWRNVDDTTDYNQGDLRFGAVRLANKEECKRHFDEAPVKTIIDKYMICSMVEGNLDDAGGIIKKDEADPNSYKKDCAPGSLRMGDENDHGGPLVTWRGPKEVLIGVASVFKVQGTTKECVAPFLYTSTHCNGAFIHCLMNSNNQTSRQKLNDRCETLAREGGFKIIRRSISWINHPDGPAENEIGALRDTKPEPHNTKIRMRPLMRMEKLN